MYTLLFYLVPFVIQFSYTTAFKSGAPCKAVEKMIPSPEKHEIQLSDMEDNNIRKSFDIELSRPCYDDESYVTGMQILHYYVH